MPRQARIDTPGALHHVIAGGVDGIAIFRNDRDRGFFVERPGVILEETETACYSWALLPNHFHLLLRTGTIPLSKTMRRLITGHTVTFCVMAVRNICFRIAINRFSAKGMPIFLS